MKEEQSTGEVETKQQSTTTPSQTTQQREEEQSTGELETKQHSTTTPSQTTQQMEWD